MKPGRNDLCPCNSAKKYKKCCGQDRGAVSSPDSLRLQSVVATPRDPVTQQQMDQLVTMFNAGRFGELESNARTLLEQYPESGFAWKAFSTALRMQGKDALYALQKATTLLPFDAEISSNLGNALREIGQLEGAVACYLHALKIKPDFVEANCNLGNALRDLGQLDDAVAYCRRALEIKPDFVNAHNNLGNALRDLGQLDAALASYRRALELKPDLAEAHNNLGNTLQDLGQLDAATASYRRALAYYPEYADAHINLGKALRKQGCASAAEASCRRALELNPKLAGAIAFMADLHTDKGRFADAETLFRHAISIEAESPEAWAGIPRIRKMTSDDADWLESAQQIVGQALPPRQEVLLRYAIGKYYDDVGGYEQAFVNYRRANELTKLYGAKYDRQLQTQAVDLLANVYDRKRISHLAQHANASARPIFIVGMPRSGTSLAEQILASHPSVFGAGELTFWNITSKILSSTVDNDQANPYLMRRLAEDYLQLLQGYSLDALRVVDKMPGNFHFLGQIHSVFPNARIIHMQRNPIDTCLSIYFQRFETVHTYANDLDDLAHYYAEYSRAMAHWSATLPQHAILHVPYEGLVGDQEGWTRKMLDFVGMPWDARCLDFHQCDRTVNTVSNWQVRQKITNTSVLRWRHYEKFVGPLLKLMDSDRARSNDATVSSSADSTNAASDALATSVVDKPAATNKVRTRRTAEPALSGT